MAVTVLKMTPLHCVVAISGAGVGTITLATDLLRTNETADTPVVNICAIHSAIPIAGESATVVRNAVTLWNLPGTYRHEFVGFSDTRENASDITVTIPAGGGTVILELLKVDGYGNDQQRKTAGGDLLL